MNLNPRQNFRKSEHAKGWNDLVDSERFQAAATAALTAMQQELPPAPDMATGASYHWRMEGAKQFLRILMSLNESQEQPKPKPHQNLIDT